METLTMDRLSAPAAESLTTAATLFAGPGVEATTTSPSVNVRFFALCV